MKEEKKEIDLSFVEIVNRHSEEIKSIEKLNTELDGRFDRAIEWIMNTILVVLIVVVLFCIITKPERVDAAEKMTETEVYFICMDVGQKYNICPEFLRAIVESESNYNPNIVGNSNDTGLMQIIPKYHTDRMLKLGAYSLFNPVSNITVGADYLAELFAKYDDTAMVLMSYNMGEKRAKELLDSGIISEYATAILNRSAELERLNGK